MIEIIDLVDKKQWDEFVCNHIYGNIFQTSHMAEVYRFTKNYEPISLAAIDSNTGEILAIVQGVLINEKGKLFSRFMSRSVIQGGPLFIEGEKGKLASNLLMKHYDNIVCKKVLYSQIRNMWDASDINYILESIGYKYTPHLDFLIDLGRTEDEIWVGIDKSRRRGIKQAEKKDISIVELKDSKEIPIFYDIVKETYKKAKAPLSDITIFESVTRFLVPKNLASLYLVKYNDTYIGARAVLKYKGLIYDWYAASLPSYSNMRVNELLVWNILKEHSNQKCSMFDFGGAGNPDVEYGVRNFKSSFGGKMTNFGRYNKIYLPMLLKMIEIGLKLYRKF